MAIPVQAAVTEAWVQRYDSPEHEDEFALAVAVDSSGNVLMIGHSHDGTSANLSYMAKYAAADGELLWERRREVLAGGGYATAIAVDDSDNVVVAGWMRSFNRYVTLLYVAKYAGADGTLLWEKQGTSGGGARAIVVDASGNVIVTGYTLGTKGFSDSYTAKYAATNGALLWEQSFSGPTNNSDSTSVAVDFNGNVVITSHSYSGVEYFYDFYTIKYAATDGALLWQKYSPRRYLSAEAMVVDANGDVVVTGGSLVPGTGGWPAYHYTAKYASLDGALLWENRGPAGAATAAALDGGGNVLVTGFSSGFYTAKYAAADGALLWKKSGPRGFAASVLVDSSGNVVIAGTDEHGGIGNNNSDYYTAKYAGVDGALLWEKRYNGSVDGNDTIDGSRSLALGPNGTVVITGYSDIVLDSDYEHDIATVVYREILQPVISCPPDTTTKASGKSGAVVTFAVTATGDSGLPPVVMCAPPGGSVFPIGQTTVTCTATDGGGLSSTCSFTVTVRGARGIKQSVLAELIALRGKVKDREACRALDDAIAHLTQSLSAEYWEDETHLERKYGERVFREEQAAARNLCELNQNKKSSVSSKLLEELVEQLSQADRLLAAVAIEEAITAGVRQKKIEQAQTFLARGDSDADDKDCTQGIEEYRQAWKRVARPSVVPKRHSDGRVRLEIAAEPGDRLLIQASSNLRDWLTLGRCTIGSDGLANHDDRDARGQGARFYRVVDE